MRRRTVDISGPIINQLQQRLVERTVSDALAVQPTLAGSLKVRPLFTTLTSLRTCQPLELDQYQQETIIRSGAMLLLI